VPVVALVEIQAEDISKVRNELEPEEFVIAFYELVGLFNIGIIMEVENQQALFDVMTQRIRTIPGVHETRFHLISNGVVI